jgi:hypothetical protein
VLQYKKLVKKKDHFSEAIKLHMLQNAVHAVPELQQVKIQADQLATQTDRQLSYAEYVTLLYSASVQYDSQFTISAGAKVAQKRQVYAHKFGYDYSLILPYRLFRLINDVQRCHDAWTHMGQVI